MTDAVIVSTARTGLGKSWRGAFNMTYGATLGAHAVRHAMARARLDPAEVEDVLMGSTFGEGTTGGNIARAIALRAGLPVTTAGLSINRFCSSGLQSIAHRRAARHDRRDATCSWPGASRASPACRTTPTRACSPIPGSSSTSPRSTGRCCRPRRIWPSATRYPGKRRTSTACAASCAPPPRRRPADSRTRSCR